MGEKNVKAGLTAALAVAALAAAGSAETPIRFDTVDGRAKQPVSLFDSVREATKDAELPAVAKTKEAAKPVQAGKLPAGVKQEPLFWGRDGRWCPDGQVYRGGPCDSSWGGGRRDPYYDDPYYRDPYRNPYDDPNWYRRDRYRRDPYYRDPYYRDPYYRDPYYRRGPDRRGPGQGPTRDPWRDPPTRGGRRR